MTWFYERDAANGEILLRFEDDGGTVHGPMSVAWPNAPGITTASDGWPTEPDVQEAAGDAATQLYTDVGVETALMALRDLAAGNVEEGLP